MRQALPQSLLAKVRTGIDHYDAFIAAVVPAPVAAIVAALFAS